MFKFGDTVEWVSQSGGYRYKKQGKIVCVVWKDQCPIRQSFLQKHSLDNHERKFDGISRDHESYLVEVQQGKTGKAKPALYWPRVNALKLVEGG